MTIRGYDPNNDCDVAVENRYKDLTGRPLQSGWLQEVAKGRVNLDVTADATPAGSEGGPIVITRPTSRTSGECWWFDCSFWE
jgi:hypothetical protein